MKMNPEALKAVLRALQKNCLDDMADDKSSPEDKMAEAVDDSGEEMVDDEDTESNDEKMAEEADPGDEQEEEDEMSKLRNFFKTPAAKAPRPGTAVMLSMSSGPKKKSIKDLMHG